MPSSFALVAMVLAPALAQAEFEAKGSVEQVYATGLEPKAKMSLLDRKGKVVDDPERRTKRAALLFRQREAGQGLPRRHAEGQQRPAPLTVLTKRSAPPDESIYDQEIEPDGYQYLETRDGTELAINVHPPYGRRRRTGRPPSRRPPGGRADARPSSSTPATATPTRPAPRAGSRSSAT